MKTVKPDVARPTPPAARVRVSNAERSAATRSKLLNATIECLYELGYHQTSTVVVTERAKVSRGSMLHHFPTKADLMIATARHIMEERANITDGYFGRMASDREVFLHLIDAHWEGVQTPAGIAYIEIMLGSRSDPEMGPRFRVLHEKLEDAQKEKIWARAQRMGVSDKRRVHAFVQLYAAALRGLAIDTLWPRSMPDIKGAVSLLKEMQVLMLDRLLTEAVPA